MNKEEAIKTLKENYCVMCAYGSQNMDTCDIRSCDNRNAIKVLEQEPCEDCISRAEALKNLALTNSKDDVYRMINSLSSVQPKTKTGHWEFVQRGKFIDICCSECGYVSVKDYAYNYTIDQLDEQEAKDFFAEAHMNFCECCGAKMLPTNSDCDSCNHRNEVDGSNCYECVKGIHNNYTADSEKE